MFNQILENLFNLDKKFPLLTRKFWFRQCYLVWTENKFFCQYCLPLILKIDYLQKEKPQISFSIQQKKKQQQQNNNLLAKDSASRRFFPKVVYKE